jgi:hypothetical protein
MPIGNPLLATYAGDKLVRTYELVGGVLVPLGVSSAYEHFPSDPATETDNILPGMAWVRDDNFLLVEHGPTDPDDSNYVRVLNPSCTQVNSFTSSAGDEIVGGVWVKMRDLFGFLYRPSTTIHPGAEFVRVAANGAPEGSTFGITNLKDTSPVEDLQLAPNGAFAIFCGHEDGAHFVTKLSANGQYPPIFSSFTPLTLELTPQCCVISGDNDTITFFDKANRQAMVYDRGTPYTKRHDLALPDVEAGDIYRAVGSPDGIYMAVVFREGTTYTTRIYKRIAGFMTVVQDIETFGRALGFTADGALFVDGASKRGFLRNDGTGEFDEVSGIGTGLANNIQRVEFSDAPYYPVATSTVFRSLLETLATGAVSFENLYVTLLKDTAAFDPDATNISDVVGSDEVTGGGWPAGGMALENVIAAYDGDVFKVSCDPLDYVTFGTSMTLRYAVVYDHDSGQPICWYDFIGNRVIASNRSMILTFPNMVVGLTR